LAAKGKQVTSDKSYMSIKIKTLESIKFTLNNTATCSAATGNQYLSETVERALQKLFLAVKAG